MKQALATQIWQKCRLTQSPPILYCRNHCQLLWNIMSGLKVKLINSLSAKVICSSHSSWSAPIIVVPNGDGGKCLVTDYRALSKVRSKFVWPTLKAEDIFPKLNGTKYFSTLELWAGYHHTPVDDTSIPKTAFTSPFQKYGSPIWLSTSTCLLLGADEQSFEGSAIHYILPRCYNHLL